MSLVNWKWTTGINRLFFLTIASKMPILALGTKSYIFKREIINKKNIFFQRHVLSFSNQLTVALSTKKLPILSLVCRNKKDYLCLNGLKTLSNFFITKSKSIKIKLLNPNFGVPPQTKKKKKKRRGLQVRGVKQCGRDARKCLWRFKFIPVERQT